MGEARLQQVPLRLHAAKAKALELCAVLAEQRRHVLLFLFLFLFLFFVDSFLQFIYLLLLLLLCGCCVAWSAAGPLECCGVEVVQPPRPLEPRLAQVPLRLAARPPPERRRR